MFLFFLLLQNNTTQKQALPRFMSTEPAFVFFRSNASQNDKFEFQMSTGDKRLVFPLLLIVQL